MVRKITSHWKPIALLAVLALSAGTLGTIFVLSAEGTAAQEKKIRHWPPLTMVYETDYLIKGRGHAELRQFTYEAWDRWEERVIESEPFEIMQGTFSTLGNSYRQEGNRLITYNAMSDSESVEIDDEVGVINIPRAGLYPRPIYGLEEFLGRELVPVTTNTRVCFEDLCTDNAPGWEFRYGDVYVVLADDARGIPVRIGEDFLKSWSCGYTPRRNPWNGSSRTRGGDGL